MLPICTVRQIALPVSPGYSTGSMWLQSGTWNGTFSIFIGVSVDGSLDRDEALEADVLHDRHDIHESGAFQHVDVALGRERLEHALEAAALGHDLRRRELLPQLELLVQ